MKEQAAPYPSIPPARVPYLLSAGEPSGDLLGAELALAMQDLWPAGQAYGIAGPAMTQAGVQALYGIEDLTVMGFVEVIKHFPRLKMLESHYLAKIKRLQPAFAVLIDYPGFHLRLAESLRMMGIPVFQYVAPQLWAWGSGRTAKLARVTDLVLGIMPFETDFFANSHVNYHYVGTPQVDRTASLARDRAVFALPAAPTSIIGLFPGSRVSEVGRILPSFQSIMADIWQQRPKTHLVVSKVPFVKAELFTDLVSPAWTSRLLHDLQVSGVFHHPELPLSVVEGRGLALMAACDAALVTSGTATLECALAGTPMAVTYRMNQLSYMLAKRLVTLPHISLVNLVANDDVVREFIQDFDHGEVARHLIALAEDVAVREAFQASMVKVRRKLRGTPGAHAAEAILAYMQIETAIKS